VPQLDMVLVGDVVDASSLVAFMPHPCWEAWVAVNAAMLTASPKKT